MTVTQVYAPTNEASEDEKDEFYKQLQEIFTDYHRHDLIVLMCDLNAKVGKDNKSRDVLGKQGVETIIDNGERICDLCSTNGIVVTLTLFPHKEYEKRLLLRCIHHFKSDLINNMDHMRISGTEPSSVILSQTK